jgi:hypothetical protein
MRYVGTIDGAGGGRLAKYVGTACEGCSIKRKCTKAVVKAAVV